MRLLPSDDFDSYSGRRWEPRGWSTFDCVSRIDHLARAYWFDLLIALLAIVAILDVVLGRGSPGAPTTTLWFCLPALAILVLPVFARRWFPFAGPAAYWLLAAGISFVDPLLIPYPESLFLLGLATAFLLGNLRDVRRAGLGLAIVVGAAATLIYNIPGHSVFQLVFIPVDFAVAWVAGLAVRARAERAEVAESRATQAEQGRDAATRVAVAEERARIARELHDIVAHAVSVMVLQVGAVRHRLPDAMAEDRDALRGVEQAGRGALAEMRRLLSVMRRDGDGLELAPQPGLDGLDSLIKEIGRAGLPVELHVAGERFPLPPGIDLSAYRIVQEGLTNALKHARATHAEVTVRYAPDEVGIEVHDDGTGATPSDGHGPRPRADRHPRARKTLRRRDDRRHDKRRRVHAQHPPPAHPRPAMTIRVLIADDQSMVRAGFRMLLAGEQDMEVVAEASNGLEAVAKAARFDPTVILMDIRMPELDGLQATRRILATDNTARILILTTFGLDEYVYEALSAGASGFVLKDDPPEQLIEAVRTVAAGDALLSPAITKRVIHQFTRIPRHEPPKELDELTAREQDILRLIARGLSNKEIGAELYISETTVKTHVTHILQKLGLRDRVQVVVLAYQTGLVPAATPT